MNTKHNLLESISLDQFYLAPSQVWGNIRLVPVIKKKIINDIRLGIRQYEEMERIVALDGKKSLLDTNTFYYSYIPHAMVASWSSDNQAVVPYGCHIETKKKGINNFVHIDYRMAKREGNQQIRFLPLHLAMEGFLSLCFGGPNIAWSEYAESVLSHGLGSREEQWISGYQINGLSEAIRIFEIHEHQVGVIIFVSDALASIFIVSHPNDYHMMHTSLLEDFYGELFYYYSQHLYNLPALDFESENIRLSEPNDLHKLVEIARITWQSQQKKLIQGILNRPINAKKITQLGPFSLQRFTTDFDNEEENYIGEVIIREDRSIEYLKTFQLSRAQTKRAYLLKTLAEHDWDLEATAITLGCDQNRLIQRLNNAGFGYFLKPQVLAAALKNKA